MLTNSEPIIELLNDAVRGKLVLPEFQRSFIWDRRSVEELLVSILNDYFIGTILLLEVTREECPFGARLIEGVPGAAIEPRSLVLDGQQRLTSLYYALYAPDLSLSNTSYPYHFFLDIDSAVARNAVARDLDEAVFSERAGSRRTESYVSSIDTQYREGVLPFTELAGWSNWDAWKDGYRDYLRATDTDHHQERLQMLSTIARTFLNYNVAIVRLEQDTHEETVVEVFERLNRTGEDLSVFELLTARLWNSGIRLRDLWTEAVEEYQSLARMAGEKPKDFQTHVLRVIALLRHQECKRKALILLAPGDFREDWESACYYVHKAVERMTSTGVGGYGAIETISLPYSTMVTPLACMLRDIESEFRNAADAYDKIHRWYWSSVFAERYGGSTDTLSYRDIGQMRGWMQGDSELPEAVSSAEDKLRQLSLRSVVRQGAVYRGVMSLIALEGALDFHTGDAIEHHELDDHHIFPTKFLQSQGYGAANDRNTIVNRTLISSTTNRGLIGGRAPADYVSQMQEELGRDRALEVLGTHFIDERAYNAMLVNDYQEFLTAREETILGAINRACAGAVDRA